MDRQAGEERHQDAAGRRSMAAHGRPLRARAHRQPPGPGDPDGWKAGIAVVAAARTTLSPSPGGARAERGPARCRKSVAVHPSRLASLAPQDDGERGRAVRGYEMTAPILTLSKISKRFG